MSIAILSTLMIPWYLMSKSFGWLDSYRGIMTASGTILMKQFFETVSDEFLEAARIDGLNAFQIWWSAALPLVAPPSASWRFSSFLAIGPRF